LAKPELSLCVFNQNPHQNTFPFALASQINNSIFFKKTVSRKPAPPSLLAEPSSERASDNPPAHPRFSTRVDV
jgi:hypothetical protein